MKEMAVRNLVQEHKAVCSSLNSIYEQKNRAYGNSFGDTYKDLGIISAVTRLATSLIDLRLSQKTVPFLRVMKV